MNMRLGLAFQYDFPRWATNAGRTLEPDETGTLLSNKDLGWLLGDEPPARWMNWLENLYYHWINVHNAQLISNITGVGGVLTGPASVDACIYNPEQGEYLIVNDAGTQNAYAFDPKNWVSGTVFPQTINAKSIAIDTANFIIARSGVTADIYYSTNPGGAWSTDTAVASTLTSIRRLITKYPDSDFLAAVDGVGAVMSAASGVGTSWLAPSVGPSYAGAANNAGFINISDTNFMILSTGSETKISTDDCDNWANTGTDPSLTTAVQLAVNQDTGTIIAIGNDAAVNEIQKTTDNGATWTTPTFTIPDTFSTGFAGWNDIQCVGSNVWVIVGEQTSNIVGYLVSVDDGETFNPVKYPAEVDGSGDAVDIKHICCSGSNMLLSGSYGKIYYSLSTPGSQKP